MKINTSFEFKSYKEQIEGEINRLKRSWEEENIDKKQWNEKYKDYKHTEPKEITDYYGILVSLDVYNAIREVYYCNIPYPRDTSELLGLMVRIDTGKGNRGIIMVDKKRFAVEKEGEQ